MSINPTQWGSTIRLAGRNAPEQSIVKTSGRPVDVRLPTTTEGWESRDCTLYTNAKLVTAITAEFTPLTAAIQCTLFTGMGGVTRSETFLMPGVGRAIHIVADSVRLDVQIEALYPASFDVTANVGIGGLYGHTTQKYVVFTTSTLSQYVDIPNYCVSYRIDCPNPQQITINGAFDTYGVTPLINGLKATEYIPIPLVANQLYLQSAVPQACYLTLLRPS